MARWNSEYYPLVLALLLIYNPLLALAAGVDDGGSGNEPGNKQDIQQRYMVVWSVAASVPAGSMEDLDEDIESVECTSDANCTVLLYGLDIALSYDTSLPSSPFCIYSHDEGKKHHHDEGKKHHHGEIGHCTCGLGKCVSYSRDYYSNGEPFYYCGPCGWVGSQCHNRSCTHPMAVCQGGYCECMDNGVFYDLNFCYIPFYGEQLAVEMLIATVVIVAFCCILAYCYHRMNNRRHPRLPEGWFRRSIRRQPPANDNPPVYDDVVEKLPSYQDALKMVSKDYIDGGLINVAFEAEPTKSPPAYDEGVVPAPLSKPISIPPSMASSMVLSKAPSTASVLSLSTTTSRPLSSSISTRISTSTHISASKSTSATSSTPDKLFFRLNQSQESEQKMETPGWLPANQSASETCQSQPMIEAELCKQTFKDKI